MRIFDKEKYIENMGAPIGCEERWVNECDGKKVVRVEEDDETYQVVGLPYNVAKVWTKEVDDIKTLEELGYEKVQDNSCLIRYVKFFELKPARHIIFSFDKEICVCEEDEKGLAVKRDYFSMEELKAIYKYCEELGWI